jgi:hypothetical protein
MNVPSTKFVRLKHVVTCIVLWPNKMLTNETECTLTNKLITINIKRTIIIQPLRLHHVEDATSQHNNGNFKEAYFRFRSNKDSSSKP